jgi:hypothetical protein
LIYGAGGISILMVSYINFHSHLTWYSLLYYYCSGQAVLLRRKNEILRERIPAFLPKRRNNPNNAPRRDN